MTGYNLPAPPHAQWFMSHFVENAQRVSVAELAAFARSTPDELIRFLLFVKDVLPDLLERHRVQIERVNELCEAANALRMKTLREKQARELEEKLVQEALAEQAAGNERRIRESVRASMPTVL